MTKKFDVVIGNPPYQDEAQGEGTRDTPIYHLFMEAAYEVAEKAVLITPARFLFNAGFTPKAWNERMLADSHVRVPIYIPHSSDVFPGTNIAGGIAITYMDKDHDGEPIGVFTRFPLLNQILDKVFANKSASLETCGITSSRSYRYTDSLYTDFPHSRSLRPAGNLALISTNTLEQFSFLYSDERPSDGRTYTGVIGLDGKDRVKRWILQDYISGPEALRAFKVIVPASRGHLGTLGDRPALVLGYPLLGEPDVAVTQTFITVGAFASKSEAEACLKYVKSKFARAMLGVLKVTQHNPASTWKYVPLQDFTSGSDIDWSKSIAEIDQQLYAKYGLSEEEIEFIETHVKPMD